jgi:CheY-like chemotaxis protein
LKQKKFSVKFFVMPPTTLARRVLVVDDNQDSREALSLALRGLEFEVMTARDGFSALNLSETFLPDIVLLDILMPGLSGFQVAERLRQHPKLSGVLLVSMSGFALETDDILWQRSGFEHHLLKPIELGILEGLLKSKRQSMSDSEPSTESRDVVG